VAIRSESGMLLQERPHLVEGPPPGGGNLVETNRLADGRESSRRNQLNGNFSGHDAFSLRRGMSLGVVVGCEASAAGQVEFGRARHELWLWE
jgi:hypothetical protein